ncbi:MAG: glycosyltransferase [Candidatus Babeliales bacterium]
MNRKRKILILSCQGGGGHMSAASAIESYLSEYDVKTADAIGNVLAHLDPLFYLSFGRYTGQDIYNFLLKHNKKQLINFFFHIGTFLIKRYKRGLKKSLTHYFKAESPDLIISVIPLFNNVIAEVAANQSIPVLIVPTDFDINTFISGVQASRLKNIGICLSIDDSEINTILKNEHSIEKDTVNITGFPVRSSFFEQKDIRALKRKFNINPAKPILMLVMGATGSTATINYIKKLCSISHPFHIIACIGRSKHLRKFIEKIKLPSHISITVIDSSEDISDVMAIADLCITKPGSVTFAELLYMNLPIIIDNTTTALLWEQLNLSLLTRYNLGDIITDYNQIESKVSAYLTSELLRQQIQDNIRKLPKKHFGTELTHIVKKLFNESVSENSKI